MTDRLRYKTRIAAVLSLPLSLFTTLAACSDGEEGGTPQVPDTEYARVVISLAPRDESRPAYTRAESAPTDAEDSEYERHIQDWWVVILDTDMKVRQVITNDPYSANPAPDSETQIDTELPIGETFTFYAFANLHDATGEGAGYIPNLKPGDTFQTDKSLSLRPIADYKSGEKVFFPMSSYPYDLTVAGEGENKVTPELIRLAGKVSWTIQNATGKKVTVKKLSFASFRTSGEIYLLPYDAAKGETTRNLLATDMQTTYAPSFPDGATPTYTSVVCYDESNEKTLSADKETVAEGFFYANETDFTAAHAAGEESHGLRLSLTTDIREGQGEPDTEFDFIRRNDWLRIPILISNAKVEIKPSQKHMPIGGLPTPLTFSPGAIVADQAIRLDHAGELTLTYELKELNGTDNASDWSLVYYTDSYETGDQFCHARIEKNEPDGKGLILEPDRTDNTGKDSVWDALPWISTDAWGYHLTAAAESGTPSGSFTVNLQELASGTAKIKLTLVARHNTQQTTVVLPYTITLLYGNAATEKGGAA